MTRSSNPLKTLMLLVCLAALHACSSNIDNPRSNDRESTPESVADLINSANQTSGAEAATLLLTASEELISRNQPTQAANALAQIQGVAALPAALQVRYALAQADIAIGRAQPAQAVGWLTGELVIDIGSLSNETQQNYQLRLANSYRANEQFQNAINAYLASVGLGSDGANTNLHDEIWTSLSNLSDDELGAFASNADSYELRGWIELARAIRQDQFNIKSQLDAVIQWRRIWSRHSASAALPSALANLQQIWEQRPTRLALLLPLQTTAGNAIQEGFLSAYYQALEVSREVPQITVFDTSNVNSITSIYNEAVSSGADLIIGPLDKALVNQLHQSRRLPVPTLALNYADDTASGPANLFQFGLSPDDEMEQAARLAWNAGYRNAAIITPQTEDYLRLRSVFADIWQARGGTVVSNASFTGDSDYAQVVKRLMAIDSSESRADRLLEILPRNNMEFIPRRREDIDFIFLIANPGQGRQLKPTLAFYFAEDVPVFALPSIYDGLQNQSANRDLDGIVFTDAPWVLDSSDPLRESVIENLRQVQGPLQRLRAMGVDSFRLYPLLQQLGSQQIKQVQGTTGILTMTANRRIRRELEVAKFIDGAATIFALETVASD